MRKMKSLFWYNFRINFYGFSGICSGVDCQMTIAFADSVVYLENYLEFWFENIPHFIYFSQYFRFSLLFFFRFFSPYSANSCCSVLASNHCSIPFLPLSPHFSMAIQWNLSQSSALSSFPIFSNFLFTEVWLGWLELIANTPIPSRAQVFLINEPSLRGEDAKKEETVLCFQKKECGLEVGESSGWSGKWVIKMTE